MLFNSVEFLVLFAVVFGCYWQLERHAQNLLLLIASLFFYAWWDARFLALIIFSAAVDYRCALTIAAGGDAHRRRRVLLFGLSINLALLGYFKYCNFFIDSALELSAALGLELPRPVLSVILPIGISFYTFQSMCYTIDVYRGRQEPISDFLDLLLYVCFFPQLVAGPIERAGHMLPQFQQPRTLRYEQVTSGLALAAWGFFKKLAIADNIAPIVDPVFGNLSQATSADLALATVLFSVQIYADFSGYTDIARGVARTLGIELRINFLRPYSPVIRSNSGSVGTSACLPGSRTICTSRWRCTTCENPVASSTGTWRTSFRWA